MSDFTEHSMNLLIPALVVVVIVLLVLSRWKVDLSFLKRVRLPKKKVAQGQAAPQAPPAKAKKPFPLGLWFLAILFLLVPVTIALVHIVMAVKDATGYDDPIRAAVTAQATVEGKDYTYRRPTLPPGTGPGRKRKVVLSPGETAVFSDTSPSGKNSVWYTTAPCGTVVLRVGKESCPQSSATRPFCLTHTGKTKKRASVYVWIDSKAPPKVCA